MIVATDNDDGIEETAWRWLRELYLRLLCPAGVNPAGMTEPERNLLLDKHHRAMEADLQMVKLLVERGQATAIEGWRERIHKIEGVDNEMLDEALHYAQNTTDDDVDV